MRSNTLVLWILSIFLAARFVYSADIYVSPTGDDAAAGTQAAPLKTIAAARDAADKVKASGAVNVYLLDGTYYLSAPVVFGEANSGTEGAPIIYQSAPGKKAVISGGIKLPSTTAWAAATINGVSVQHTTITPNLHVDQLFLNGSLQILARYPDFVATTKVLNGNTNNGAALSKATSCANPAEGPGYLRGIHSSSWGGNDYYFIAGGKTQWVGDNNRGSGLDATHRMV